VKRIAALVLALVGIALTAAPAAADEQIPSGSAWGGSSVTRPEPVTSSIVQLTINGRIQNNSDLSYGEPIVAVTLSDAADGCQLAPSGPATRATLTGPTFTPNTVFPTWKRYAYTADLPFSPERNGDYSVFVCINGTRRLDTQALVRLPAPTVTNLVASADGHDVDLAWDDVRSLAPDLAGYRVERSLGADTFESVATIGPESPSYTDTTLPAAGGDVSYRVIAIRPEVSDGAPSNVAEARYAPAPSGSGATGTGGDAAGGSGGADGSGGAAGGGTSASGRLGGRPSRPSGPTIAIPRVGTPSRNFFPALLAPPVDTGFSEELPYDVDGEDSELAADEPGSDPTDALPGRGLVIPVATGLVLAVWALHLRFLARASRPQYEDPIEILG
jgi:hypothetical protein